MIAEFDIYVLADVDAALNMTALALTLAGLVAVRRGNTALHKKLMISAAIVSAVFLCCYLTYHSLKPEPVRYQGEGFMKGVYYFVLFTHIPLAALVAPMILRTLWLGLKDDRERHRRWARWTAPIWLYVSATGVLVWTFLYL